MSPQWGRWAGGSPVLPRESCPCLFLFIEDHAPFPCIVMLVLYGLLNVGPLPVRCEADVQVCELFLIFFILLFDEETFLILFMFIMQTFKSPALCHFLIF